VNWNWPGEISLGLPITDQLFKGNAGFVVARTLKGVPGELVNTNWQSPLASILVSISLNIEGIDALMRRILLMLGMPLTITVTKAQPGASPWTGAEVKEVAEQLLEVRTTVRSLPKLHS